MKLEEFPSECPACGAPLKGDEIPPETRHLFGLVHTHFYRWSIVKDGGTWIALRCPDCKREFVQNTLSQHSQQ